MLKIRDGVVTNRPVYVVIGVTVNGERDMLRLWEWIFAEWTGTLRRRHDSPDQAGWPGSTEMCG
jgi:hypothetical protein